MGKYTVINHIQIPSPARHSVLNATRENRHKITSKTEAHIDIANFNSKWWVLLLD